MLLLIKGITFVISGLIDKGYIKLVPISHWTSGLTCIKPNCFHQD